MSGATGFMPLLLGWWWLALVVFLRVGAMMAVLPGLGEQTVPVRVRLALGLVLTVTILPRPGPTWRCRRRASARWPGRCSPNP